MVSSSKQTQLDLKVSHSRFLVNTMNKFVNDLLTHSFLKHPFSTPWKDQKTVRFSDVFMG